MNTSENNDHVGCFKMTIAEVVVYRREIVMSQNSHESTIGKLAMGELPKIRMRAR